MKDKSGTFKVEEVNGKPIASIPEAKAGDYANFDWNKIPYTYKEYENLEEARKEYSDKDVLDLLNGTEKANAKAKEYQRVTKPFRPDLSTPEAKKEQMITDMIKRFGVDADTARKTIEALIASGNAPSA